jgi:hypothetical protein
MLQRFPLAYAAPALILLAFTAASAGNKTSRMPLSALTLISARTYHASSSVPNPSPGSDASSLEFAPDEACSMVKKFIGVFQMF